MQHFCGAWYGEFSSTVENFAVLFQYGEITCHSLIIAFQSEIMAYLKGFNPLDIDDSIQNM